MSSDREALSCGDSGLAVVGGPVIGSEQPVHASVPSARNSAAANERRVECTWPPEGGARAAGASPRRLRTCPIFAGSTSDPAHHPHVSSIRLTYVVKSPLGA